MAVAEGVVVEPQQSRSLAFIGLAELQGLIEKMSFNLLQRFPQVHTRGRQRWQALEPGFRIAGDRIVCVFETQILGAQFWLTAGQRCFFD